MHQGRLNALADWAADDAQKDWRKLAVDPEQFESQLQEEGCPSFKDCEILFCLGWAEHAFKQFVKNGKLHDHDLVCAIRKAKKKGKGVRAG